MATGIRIQPSGYMLQSLGVQRDDMKYRPVLVRDVSRPLPPYECGACNALHDCKTYHLVLDADGTVMVSTTIWDNMLKMYDCGGFEKVNEVKKPPAQGLVLPTAVVEVQPAEM